MVEDVLSVAQAWKNEGRKVALATVVATWGSSPRPAGSQLVVDEDGRMQGSVSGGCIEGAVVKEARDCMEGAPPRLLDSACPTSRLGKWVSPAAVPSRSMSRR